MSDVLAFPPAVVLGLWLNAAQTHSVSLTDAANALETITNQVAVEAFQDGTGAEDCCWFDLVKQVASLRTPVAVGLPIDGDPAGVPQNVLSKIERSSGVIAINQDLLLVKMTGSSWALVSAKNTVMHYDLNQTRRSLTEQVASSAALLAASDLVGDETEIVDSLKAFHTLDLPPHLSKRTTDSLESAAKILIVARGAIMNSVALHSPSTDRLRLQILEELMAKSRSVLQSVVTN